ncbi:restriction endonuclease subunit S [Dickeya oryzae]|uniref:Restriction endonuclease subunit S n=1 Tax=Dickeya oryzae TaxID=1240404 RepID=A0AB39IDQ7_9GAMM|nr:restriction endonuclease subunit S [Dickeya oryzae]MCA6994875.1 restriction endonuclease subunit S [Dickeya oryzae]
MTLTAMPKYDAYKDSGVEWLRAIPAHWQVMRFKFLSSITTGSKNTEDKIDNGEYPFFVRSQIPERINTYSYDGEAILTAGDGAGVGRVYHYVNGKFDFHQRVYKFSDFKIVTGKFLYHYLYINFANVAMLGTAKSTVDSLRLPLIQDFQICFPPCHDEQKNIVSFIDKITFQIDAAISIKEQQIALLNERKQILIQQAVTQGLDPTVPMKDSGIEWIGEIPEHWIVKRAKYLFNEIDERSVNGDEELLSVSHITGVTPRSEKNVNMFMAEDYSGSKTCEKNDLVFNIMWAWMGALGVSDRRGIVSPSYGVFRAKAENTFNPIFLEYLLKSISYVEHYNKVSTGLHSSRLRFYAHMFFDMELGYPSFDEQNSIVKYVQKESDAIDKALSLQQQQIEVLKEYKTTLINSAVTGKIKVV